MEKKLYELMDWPAIERIIYSDSVHPKQTLGQRITKSGLLIQAHYPNAVRAYVKSDEGPIQEMQQIDEKGYFAILINSKKKIKYNLMYEFADGNIIQVPDVYNYNSTIPTKELNSFRAGNNCNMYKFLGAHVKEIDGVKGVQFAVWAPNAMRVSVVGDFNNWDGRIHQMEMLDEYGIFELFIPGITEGSLYKYEIRMQGGAIVLKADPYGFGTELRPNTASLVWDIDKFKWTDDKWMQSRDKKKYKSQPFSIYEIHPGSFKKPDDGRLFYNYRELAPMVISHVKKMGFTHVELLPVMEHPFDASWGYQVTGYFAPTSRYGTPDDFKYFMNEMHKAGIGVILDWVPAHFPKDEAGLARFDGTCLYEHMDKRKGEHPDWGTLIFNYGRYEVMDFLMSSAVFWGKEYHADGIRVDAVASMLYLDFGRKVGEWEPNIYGGHENLEAVEFIKRLNTAFNKQCPGALLIAEESTAWPRVTGDPKEDSLGYDYKWNMGWMNDFLGFISTDPLFRKHRYNELTFSMIYAYTEDFILTLSHDEVVHGKGSMLTKMPGATKAEKMANLRTAYTFMFTHPGKKLLFMGQEFGQENEWCDAYPIEWHLTENEENQQLMTFVKDLNALYKKEPALHELDFTPAGFEWINNISADECVVVYVRKASNGDELVVVANFTPVIRSDYKIGVPHMGKYKEIFNSNALKYGGDGVVNKRTFVSVKDECDGREDSIRILLPGMGVSVLRYIPADTTPKINMKGKNTAAKKAGAVKRAAAQKAADIKNTKKSVKTGKKEE